MTKKDNSDSINLRLAKLKISENGRHALVTFGDGRANLLNCKLLEDLNCIIKAVLGNKKLRACSIAGAGRSFSLGVDLEDILSLGPAEQQDIINRARAITRRLYNSSIPIIGLIDGFCLGGGLELALSCHMRLATAKSKFGFPEISHGIFPGLNGIEASMQILGKNSSLFLILSGEIITAPKALEIGLVNKVVEKKEDLLNEAAIQVQSISNTPNEVIEHILSTIKTNVLDDLHYKKSDKLFISLLNRT